MTDLTADRARELLDYNPETGVLRWRVATTRRIRAGDVAGCREPDGRIQVRVGGRLHRAHRVIWLMMTGEWPPCLVDHINGDPSDNRWANLRAASHSQNRWNMRRHERNTSGFKGVSFDARRRKWRATIKVGNRQKWLGYHASPEDAHEAYKQAARENFGEFSRFK